MKQVTAAIIIEGGKVLLTRRGPCGKLPGFWEFPGGKIEDGESPQACLERELREELGIDAKAGKILTESKYYYEHGACNLLALETTIIDGVLTLSVHDKAEWVPFDELEQYKLAPADIPIAKFLKERTNGI